MIEPWTFAREGPGVKKVVIGVVVAAVLAGVGYGVNEFLHRPSFAVGDCVRLSQRAFDQDMVKASCESTTAESGLDGVVYKVDKVIDGSSAGCSGWSYDIEFSHEPDDTTYCLVRSGSQPSGSPVPTTVDPDEFLGDGAPPECTEPAMAGDPIPEFCDQYGY